MDVEAKSSPSKHNTRTNEAWSAPSVFLFTVGLNASRASSYMYEMSSFAITDVLQKHNVVVSAANAVTPCKNIIAIAITTLVVFLNKFILVPFYLLIISIVYHLRCL